MNTAIAVVLIAFGVGLLWWSYTPALEVNFVTGKAYRHGWPVPIENYISVRGGEWTDKGLYVRGPDTEGGMISTTSGAQKTP